MEKQIKEFDSLIDLLEDLDREGIAGEEKREKVDRFLLLKSRVHGRPYSAAFELTSRCNFDCKMCYVHLNEAQIQKEGRVLTTEQWMDIARQTVDAGVNLVELTGGECLTHPGFFEIYTYLVQRGVRVAVFTNGQLISDEIVRLFQQYPPSMVQISVYGSSPEAYVKVTGRDAFQDVMDAIAKLKEAKINLTLAVTPNRFMQKDVEPLLELIHSWGLRYRIGSSTLPARPETGREIADYIVDNEIYHQISKLEKEFWKNKNDSATVPKSSYRFSVKGMKNEIGIPCAAGAATFQINWKGEMTPCPAFFTVTKSVLDSSIEEAWQCIRKAMRTWQEPAECGTCPDKIRCMGCPGEKTSGVLNGSVNLWVCKRCNELNNTDAADLDDCTEV